MTVTSQSAKKNDVLVHHGIKGMKWGVRRYRNKDGSLTPEGKRRYRELVTPDEQYTQKALKEGFDRKVDRGVEAYVLGRHVSVPFVAEVIRENQALIDATIAQQTAVSVAQANAELARMEAERASRQAASLAISGGMNPFLFG